MTKFKKNNSISREIDNIKSFHTVENKYSANISIGSLLKILEILDSLYALDEVDV
jgi:hypothetical protein